MRIKANNDGTFYNDDSFAGEKNLKEWIEHDERKNCIQSEFKIVQEMASKNKMGEKKCNDDWNHDRSNEYFWKMSH